MNSVSAVLCTRKSVHMPRSKIGVLAHQAQSAGIFAFGEYLVTRYPSRDAVFLSFGGATRDLNSVSAVLCTRKSVHIPRSKIGVLAHQAQSVGIFASGEYLGDASNAS